MIFVTVGTELPFDRLVRVVDAWARDEKRRDVFAQIGNSLLKPAYMQFSHFLTAAECRARFDTATLVISHAGMGSILTALTMGKPIIVLPRRASLGEHRNEHQLATAKRLLELGRISVAWDDDELRAKLHDVEGVKAASRIDPYAGAELQSAVRGFIGEQAAIMELQRSFPLTGLRRVIAAKRRTIQARQASG